MDKPEDPVPGTLLRAGWRSARRLLILLLGASVVVVGVAMVVLPGPAIVVIPAGLAILATEFLWARRLLRRLGRLVPGGEERALDQGSFAPPPPGRHHVSARPGQPTAPERPCPPCAPTEPSA